MQTAAQAENFHCNLDFPRTVHHSLLFTSSSLFSVFVLNKKNIIFVLLNTNSLETHALPRLLIVDPIVYPRLVLNYDFNYLSNHMCSVYVEGVGGGSEWGKIWGESWSSQLLLSICQYTIITIKFQVIHCKATFLLHTSIRILIHILTFNNIQ